MACPNGLTTDYGINALEAWRKGQDFALIEGDGVFGIGNWGHVPESLAWYCKAWAAGNAVAAYDIAEILREGYNVNSRGPGGQVITRHVAPDPSAAFYWYRLSGEHEFTKGILAVAQYYALGDEVLKGSRVARDLPRAASLLSQAAQLGDTTALTMLAARYAGKTTVPWVMAIPMSTDYAKALELALKAKAILARFGPDCAGSDAVNDMIALLPNASEGRASRGATVVEVHGSSARRPMQVGCILSLGAPPSSQQDESTIDQFYRLIHGGAVNTWGYSITQIPGINSSIMLRQTATDAMIQGVEELAVLLQTVSPSSNSAPSRDATREQSPNQAPKSRVGPNGWRRFDMNGIWEASYGVRGTPDFRVMDIKIEDDGDYITAELLSPPANATPDDIVLFTAIYDSNDIQATMSPDSKTSGRPNYRQGKIHIDDADHFRLDGYPQFQRLNR